MAYKVRWFHLIVGALVVYLLVYSFYSTYILSFRRKNEVQPLNEDEPSTHTATIPDSHKQRQEKASINDGNKSTSSLQYTFSLSMTASPALISAPISIPGNSNMSMVIQTIMSEAIQKIQPKSSKPQPTQNRAGSGVLTRTLYVGGFKSSRSASCTNDDQGLKLLVAITSTPRNNEARMAIRLTWGHYALQQGIKVLFFLGQVSDPQLSNVLDEEDKLYGDLVRAEFLDSYTNLTLKTVSILDWTDRFCSSVKFLLKTDDDMFINVPNLLNFTKMHSEDKNTIFGRLANKWGPVRNKASKYYISPQEYDKRVFPDFTTGPAYLLTGDVVHRLFEKALNRTYFKLEDVYITGIVADQIGIKRVHASGFLNEHVKPNVCDIQKSISIHEVKFRDQFYFWKMLWNSETKCKRRLKLM